MSKIKGTVTGVGKGKFSYFVMLDGENFYYNTKFEPKCGEGDVVGIDFEPKAENRGNIRKLTILESHSEGYDPKPRGGEWKVKAGGGDRQDSIIWQHSQQMAISASVVIIEHGGYTLKGTADKKRIQIEGLIDELTARFFNDASDPRKSAAFKDAEEISDDAAEAEGGGDPEQGDGEWKDDDSWDD